MGTALKNKTVFVAGGTGFIGRTTVPALRAAGYQVMVLSRHRGGDGVVQWDGKTITSTLMSSLHGAYAVINLCGDSWGTYDVKSRIGTADLFRVAFARLGSNAPQRYLGASGYSIYGASIPRSVSAITESDPIGTGHLADLCQKWEASTFAVCNNVTALRFGCVIGHKCRAFQKIAQAARLGIRFFGDGRQQIPWISEQDCARAIVFLLEQGIRGPVNVVTDHERSWFWFSTIARAFSFWEKSPISFGVPAPLTKLIPVDIRETVLSHVPVKPHILTSNGFVGNDRDFDRVIASAVK